ncbi:Caveolin-2 [Mactra antiquata]
MRKSKVSAIRNVDVLDNLPGGLYESHIVSPVTTSSIRPEFNLDQSNTETISKTRVAEETVKYSKNVFTTRDKLDVKQGNIDIIDRDPHGINAHITIQFEEVIGEVTHLRSLTNCWNCVRCCYTFWKDLLYKLLSLCCAFPNAVIFGCWFGLNAFLLVWILTPFSHACNMCCGTCIRKMANQCFSCAVGVPCRICGQLFWACNKKAKISNQKGRVARVTFSDKIRTKRIPRANKEDKLSESQKRVLFSRSPWQRKLF